MILTHCLIGHAVLTYVYHLFFITILNACIISITYRWCLDISWFLYFGWQFNIRAILLSERVYLFIYFFYIILLLLLQLYQRATVLRCRNRQTEKRILGVFFPVFFFTYVFSMWSFALSWYLLISVCISRSYRWLFHFHSVFIFYTYGLVFSRLGLFAKHKNAALFFSRVSFFCLKYWRRPLHRTVSAMKCAWCALLSAFIPTFIIAALECMCVCECMLVCLFSFASFLFFFLCKIYVYKNAVLLLHKKSWAQFGSAQNIPNGK